MSRPEVLRIDRIACTGHGQCAELLPELLTLDEWGYPVQHGTAVPGGLRAHARRAVRGCPRLALRLTAPDSPSGAADRARTTQTRS